MADPNELLSTEQAADVIDISTRRVQELCKQGKIPAIRVGKGYVIRRADAEAFAVLERPVGRPPKKTEGDVA